MRKFSKVLALVAVGSILATGQAMAALTVDTTAIEADIATAGASGLTIALAVAGVAIGIALVRKLVK